jgi:HNH endonuclease
MKKPLPSVAASTYCNRFGSWRKALEAFVRSVNSEADVSVESPKLPEHAEETLPASGAEPRTPRKSARTALWRLRFLVMRRDGFRCCCCGTSPAIAAGVILEVDHVVPWSKGGETVEENPQTLCQTCNGGKSNLPFELSAEVKTDDSSALST